MSSTPEHELYCNPVCRLDLREDGWVVFTRLDGKLDVANDFARMVEEVRDVVRNATPRARGFVMDTRRGQGKQSDQFEAIAGDFNRFVVELFGRIAWVVETAIGELQAQRYARALGIELRAFRSLEEAIAWLDECDAPVGET